MGTFNETQKEEVIREIETVIERAGGTETCMEFLSNITHTLADEDPVGAEEIKFVEMLKGVFLKVILAR